MNNKELMNHAADNIRLLAVSMVEKAKSGHPGGAMGGADFINVLFSEFLVYDPDQPTWEGRDRFFLDPGHMSPMLYSALALQGKFTIEELKTFRQWGSDCPGHPERDIATRAASAACLGVLAEQVPNMICSSADLCNSDKTDGFLKKTHDLAADDFTGAFFQAGVSELAMACVCIGMYLHGGVIPACGTFFVFSDYMKPAIRMAALMRVPIKFIWTHDAFRVGEDGPTHEPVEQEAQIRLMEKLKNHKGQDSVRVFRPADADEATVCWQMAMENMDTPTALIFSRQNITSLPEGNDYEQARKGAYVVKGSDEDYDVILLASGSEVSTLLAGAELLRKDGVKTRIVSVPSEGLFRNQSAEYQEAVLPKGSKIFGLTAGLPVNLLGLVGANGKIWGLESFGYSAPYKVLDEKLGFTAENVYKQVKEFLS